MPLAASPAHSHPSDASSRRHSLHTPPVRLPPPPHLLGPPSPPDLDGGGLSQPLLYSAVPAYHPPPVVSPPRLPSYSASVHCTPSTSSLFEYTRAPTPASLYQHQYSAQPSPSPLGAAPPTYPSTTYPSTTPHRTNTTRTARTPSTSSTSTTTSTTSTFTSTAASATASNIPTSPSLGTWATSPSGQPYSADNAYAAYGPSEEDYITYRLSQMSRSLAQRRKDERAGRRTRQLEPEVWVDQEEKDRRERDALEKMGVLHEERLRAAAFREWERRRRSERVRRSWG